MHGLRPKLVHDYFPLFNRTGRSPAPAENELLKIVPDITNLVVWENLERKRAGRVLELQEVSLYVSIFTLQANTLVNLHDEQGQFSLYYFVPFSLAEFAQYFPNE